jgi:5'-nucleotidase
MSLAAEVAYDVASRLLDLSLPAGTLLNVNVPPIDRANYRGVKVTRQGHNAWKDGYDVRKDPQGHPYYWLTGEFVTLSEQEDGDDFAVQQGWTAVTPIHYELTNVAELNRLKGLFER